MNKPKIKIYMDKLMQDRDFKEKFNQEFQNLVISEQIAQLRHSAHLTQDRLAKKIHTTKSAISRYESAKYNNYSIPLLNRIAHACHAELKVIFILQKAETRKHSAIF